SQERFLHYPAAADQRSPVARFKLAAELFFHVMRNGQVEIVSAENEMFADRDAVKEHLAAACGPDADEREIAGSAADIADEDLLPGLDALLPVFALRPDPGVKRRLRLFNQHDMNKPRLFRRLDGQFPGDFIK